MNRGVWPQVRIGLFFTYKGTKHDIYLIGVYCTLGSQTVVAGGI